MTRVETATCQDCGWQGPVEATKEFRNVWDRVLPGDVMPAGECPAKGCGGAAMLDAGRHGADDLRPQMVALMIGLDRLRGDLPNDVLCSPVAFHLKQLADYARRALASGPPVRPVCNACGGASVRVDAWASWDVDAQRWELHSTCEAGAICADCGLECSYTMKPVTEPA